MIHKIYVFYAQREIRAFNVCYFHFVFYFTNLRRDFVFLCLRRRLAAEAILFPAYPCVCAYVRHHILKDCEHDISQTDHGNFTKFIN